MSRPIPREYLSTLLVVLALAAPALADEQPFRELVLPEPVDFVRAVQRGDTLHVVYARGQRCFYARGTAEALGEALPVDREGPEVIAGGERGPWLHVTDDAVLVLWQIRGGLHLVRSADQGRTWQRIRATDDGAQGMDMPFLGGGPRGRVYVGWVDGRDGKRAGDGVAAELYLATSTDGGQTFERPVKVTADAPGVCPCCQPSLVADEEGKVWIAYRASSRNTKEIELLRVDGRRVTAAQVSKDAWRFDGCPMAGPALAVAGRGESFVLAWRRENDVQVAISRRGPSRFEAPERLGRGRYYATAVDGRGRLLLLWDEGAQTGYRELWQGGRSGRADRPASGFLLGLPEGYLRVRGG